MSVRRPAPPLRSRPYRIARNSSLSVKACRPGANAGVANVVAGSGKRAATAAGRAGGTGSGGPPFDAAGVALTGGVGGVAVAAGDGGCGAGAGAIRAGGIGKGGIGKGGSGDEAQAATARVTATSAAVRPAGRRSLARIKLSTARERRSRYEYSRGPVVAHASPAAAGAAAVRFVATKSSRRARTGTLPPSRPGAHRSRKALLPLLHNVQGSPVHIRALLAGRQRRRESSP